MIRLQKTFRGVLSAQRTSTRAFAKILRWEPDTKYARQMESITECDEFCKFCVDNQASFTKRDWIAGLTYLTTRRRVNIRSEPFKQFHSAVWERRDLLLPKLHIVLHRYGVMAYAPALTRFLPLLKVQLPTMDGQQLALSAWALGRGLVGCTDTWQEIGREVMKHAESGTLNPTDLGLLSWAYANIERRSPKELVVIKEQIRKHLIETKDFSVQDLCMCLQSFITLTPNDLAFTTAILKVIKTGLETKSFHLQAPSACAIWDALAKVQWKDAEFIELLTEECRTLRMDHTFNQTHCSKLAKAIRALKYNDPRIVFQITDFVDRKGVTMRMQDVLTVAEVFADMKIHDEGAWKRIGRRSQDRGMQLEVNELHRLKNAFIRSGRGNQRVYGMLQLHLQVRQDQQQYGPC